MHSSRHDIPTSYGGLAGTQHSSSIYGTEVFDLILFNEVTQSNNILTNIRACVIDSCIEMIIGLPDLRSHPLIHRIPSPHTWNPMRKGTEPPHTWNPTVDARC